ncbi:hypothetical protein G6M89_13055 [Natronolimnobius sp. AArcel1]|uniref:hypothetical protein n=1 Tax=Natronolimnobius sp. AArcel1 TaxID=1679093 RepID=UPI0013ECADEC|nr:hypothetical protein [Natronolimnobius sp. AArcel1]NGM69928.1 hypothetical protein [Natronolimnobius sp. AArcel1]
MGRDVTRRETLVGIGSAVAVGASTRPARAETVTEADASDIVEHDLETEYPTCVYKRDDDGEWRVSMPINVRVRVPGDQPALAAVEAEFTGVTNLEWTQLLPDSPTRAWDDRREELVKPALSVRRPRLGDGWAHVHVWPVDAERAAIHAHLDVFDLSSSYFHRGDDYDEAARAVSRQFTDEGTASLNPADWDLQTPYSIDYGVEDERLERWGETGDRKLELG